MIITDGHSDSQTQTIIQANFMKLAAIKIVCIGVVTRLDAGYLELQQIATDPEEVVRLQVDNFNQLSSNLAPLVAAACPPAPEPGLCPEFFYHLIHLPLPSTTLMPTRDYYCCWRSMSAESLLRQPKRQRLI